MVAWILAHCHRRDYPKANTIIKTHFGIDLKVGRRNQIVTVIPSMSNTRAVIMHFHVSKLQFDYTPCAHAGVQGWQTSPCLQHPAAARTRTQSKKAAKGAQVPSIFSKSGMQVFDLLHKATQLSRYKHTACAKADDYFCCIFLNVFWGLCETQAENSCSLQSTSAPYMCKPYICNFIAYVTGLWWVDFSWMPGEHQSCSP